MVIFNFESNFIDNGKNYIFFVNNQKEISSNAKSLDNKLDGAISNALETFDDFEGKFAEYKFIYTNTKENKINTILLFGVGDTNHLSESKLDNLGGIIASGLKNLRLKDVIIDSTNLSCSEGNNVSANIAFGMRLGIYKFDKYITDAKQNKKLPLEHVKFIEDNSKAAKEKYNELNVIADGIYEARDVISEPGNILYPAIYAKRIKEKLEPLNVEVEVLGEQEMEHLGMGALLGVGRGSEKESKLVIMKYTGLNDGSKPVGFVGKGVTFDTGGISLKPARDMGDMKYDMSGSAAVFGAMYALAARKAKVNAVGVVGLVENMPDGAAQRPGDIVRTMSGKTVEILNTDAEGRLVLADALWYTKEKFEPKFIIDLATLTGAVIIALGTQYAGLFSDDENLRNQLLESGKKSGEDLWNLPLNEEFDKMLKSNVADLANLGAPNAHASSSTAAQFLKNFVGDVPWAHLDIAGVANLNKDQPLSPKGGVGFGVRLLNKLVKEYYEA